MLRSTIPARFRLPPPFRLPLLAMLVLLGFPAADLLAGLKTWDGKYDIGQIEVTVVYFVPSDRTPLPDWKERVAYFCRRIERFHRREFQGQSVLKTVVAETPFASARSTEQLRAGDADFIFFQTLQEVAGKLDFGSGEHKAYPVLLVLSDINWRELDDFYRLKTTEGGEQKFDGAYADGRHFPGAAAGGARAVYFPDKGLGWGLVSGDGWRVPYSGTDCVVYHEGVGHTVGLPHPQPGNGSVMSEGQYRGWINESWLDDAQKKRLGWTPPANPLDRKSDLFSAFTALPDPLVPKPLEPVSLRLTWPAGSNGAAAPRMKSCRVRYQTDLLGPWVEAPQAAPNGSAAESPAPAAGAPPSLALGAFDHATPVSYRIDLTTVDGEAVELWGYFQVRENPEVCPRPAAAIKNDPAATGRPALPGVGGVAVVGAVAKDASKGAAGGANDEALHGASNEAAPRQGDTLRLANAGVLRDLKFDGRAWRTSRFARGDGSDGLDVQSDEFHVLLMNGAELTVEQYAAVGKPELADQDGLQTITIRYAPRADVALPEGAPTGATVQYSLRGDEPYVRKNMTLALRESGAVDRLEVERFSTTARAERGGRGQPVFVDGKWFFGLEYPAGYSRHTDGNTPAQWKEPFGRFGAYPSLIDLEQHDVDRRSRAGLLRLMHFPGHARKLADGSFGIVGKTAVAGVGRRGDSMELAFLDYMRTVRRPARSFVHYNNWFDAHGKNLNIDPFATRIAAEFKQRLAPYGARLDAMVPDNYWQNGASLYEPGGWARKGTESIGELATALEAEGTGLGLWLAFDGSAALNMEWGRRERGYAVQHGFNYPHFSLAQHKFRQDLKGRLRELIATGRLRYLKHDFNNMNGLLDEAGRAVSARHGHEADVDAEIELLRFERELNPRIYLNVTNYVWFSPWWLMDADAIWMLADDAGYWNALPDPSASVMAAAYRDEWIHRAWGDPQTRPLVPISYLMTHGIIKTPQAGLHPQDTLRGFSDHLMMYHMRGTQLKEWYIAPEVLKPEEWEALGRVTRWSEENVPALANAVMVGGDPGVGQVYGYACWNGEKGIVSVRNPSPAAAEIDVPFDQSVWFRGPMGAPYAAKVIYPYQAPRGEAFRSGKPIHLKVPGYALLTLQLEPGQPKVKPEPPLTPIVWRDISADDSQTAAFRAKVQLPDEAMQSCELLLTTRGGDEAALTVNGQALAPTRESWSHGGPDWRMHRYDLAALRGQSLDLAIGDDSAFGRSGKLDAWLLLDRPVASSPADADPRLPMPVAQGYRRQTECLLTAEPGARPSASRPLTAAELRGIRAAKVRIETFGLQADICGGCKLEVNDGLTFDLPSNPGGDRWEKRTFDIPPSQIKTLQFNNTLRVRCGKGGDSFKLGRVTLTLQLADGGWTRADWPGVQTSRGDWAYFEGEVFESPLCSRPIAIHFSEKSGP